MIYFTVLQIFMPCGKSTSPRQGVNIFPERPFRQNSHFFIVIYRSKDELLIWAESIKNNEQLKPGFDIEIIFCKELEEYIPHLFSTIDIAYLEIELEPQLNAIPWRIAMEDEDTSSLNIITLEDIACTLIELEAVTELVFEFIPGLFVVATPIPEDIIPRSPSMDVMLSRLEMNRYLGITPPEYGTTLHFCEISGVYVPFIFYVGEVDEATSFANLKLLLERK